MTKELMGFCLLLIKSEAYLYRVVMSREGKGCHLVVQFAITQGCEKTLMESLSQD